jgi:cystathionine beta-lyase
LDCRGLGLNDKELDSFIKEKAKLLLEPGTIFGTGGSGFQRMNIACPRSRLLEALQRLETAVRE